MNWSQIIHSWKQEPQFFHSCSHLGGSTGSWCPPSPSCQCTCLCQVWQAQSRVLWGKENQWLHQWCVSLWPGCEGKQFVVELYPGPYSPFFTDWRDGYQHLVKVWYPRCKIFVGNTYVATNTTCMNWYLSNKMVLPIQFSCMFWIVITIVFVCRPFLLHKMSLQSRSSLCDVLTW